MSARSWLQMKFARTRLSALLVPGDWDFVIDSAFVIRMLSFRQLPPPVLLVQKNHLDGPFFRLVETVQKTRRLLSRRHRGRRRVACRFKRGTQGSLNQFGAMDLHGRQWAELAGQFIGLKRQSFFGRLAFDQFGCQARDSDSRLTAE